MADEDSPQALWKMADEVLRTTLPRGDYDNWVRPLRPLRLLDGHLVLGVPHEDFAGFVRDHYAGVIERALRSTSGLKLTPQFVVDTASVPPADAPAMRAEPAASVGAQGVLALGDSAMVGSTANAAVPLPPTGGQPRGVPGGVVEDHTFATLVEGPSNQLAVAASRLVVRDPGGGFNPVFLYGGVGLGKTHLLHAIANELHRTRPDIRVCYITSEAYMGQMMQAVRARNLPAFRARFRSECDVLLVDDVEYFAGRTGTQEEFFHTFNALHQAGRQIVMTSDRMPSALPNIAERLRTRFAWGLVADIQPPNYAMRVEIIRRKAARECIALPEDVVEYLAENITDNVRTLESAIVWLGAQASLFARKPDMALAREVLCKVCPPGQARVDVDTVIEACATYFGVTVADLRGKRRFRRFVRPRMVAMYLARHLARASFPEIGRHLGRRDHSTVLHGVKRVEQMLDSDAEIQRAVHEIRRNLTTS